MPACDLARGDRCGIEYGVVLTCVEMGCCAQTVPGERHTLMRYIYISVSNSVTKDKPYYITPALDYRANTNKVSLTKRQHWVDAFNTIPESDDLEERKIRCMSMTNNASKYATLWYDPKKKDGTNASMRSSANGWLTGMTKEEWTKFLVAADISENKKNTQHSIFGKIKQWVIRIASEQNAAKKNAA